jgi:hypothetical protein
MKEILYQKPRRPAAGWTAAGLLALFLRELYKQIIYNFMI